MREMAYSAYSVFCTGVYFILDCSVDEEVFRSTKTWLVKHDLWKPSVRCGMDSRPIPHGLVNVKLNMASTLLKANSDNL